MPVPVAKTPQIQNQVPVAKILPQPSPAQPSQRKTQPQIPAQPSLPAHQLKTQVQKRNLSKRFGQNFRSKHFGQNVSVKTFLAPKPLAISSHKTPPDSIQVPVAKLPQILNQVPVAKLLPPPHPPPSPAQPISQRKTQPQIPAQPSLPAHQLKNQVQKGNLSKLSVKTFFGTPTLNNFYKPQTPNPNSAKGLSPARLSRFRDSHGLRHGVPECQGTYWGP